MSCPSADAIQQLLDGSLASEQRATMDAHLGDCAVCRALVLQLGSAVTMPAGDLPEPETAPLKPGDQVGRFVVIARLGQGGMGIVYSAYDPELDRKVAIKLIRPRGGAGTPTAILQTRLLREAHAMAKIAHPNVTAVHEVGRRGEQLFVAMELVDGETMAQWLVRVHPAQRDILDVFVRAGRGLAAAHSAGLIHRDFKPANVMIARDGRVRVMDFGLARPLGGSDEETPGEASPRLALDVTASGALVGTPAYMAPEQMMLRRSDARSDQFAFCVSLFEALTGTRPFAGGRLDEVSDAIQAGRIERPARRVSRRILRVVERGLRAKPDERWPSMEQLLDELERQQRRRSKAATLAAVFALAAVVGIGWYELAHRQAILCRGGAAELAGVWDGPRRDELARAFRNSGSSGADNSWRAFSAAVDDYVAGWLRMYQSSCEATRLRGEQSEAMLDRRRACLSRRRAELCELVDVLRGADARMVDRAAAAATTLEPVASCAPEALLASEPTPATSAARAEMEALQAKIGRARALHAVGRFKEARPIIEDTIAEAERAHLAWLAVEARYWQGAIMQSVGQLAEAESMLRRTGIDAQALGRDDIVMRTYAMLGYLLGSVQNRYDASHIALDVAGATIRRLPGRPDLEITYLRLAASAVVAESTTTDKRRIPEGIAMLQRGLALARADGEGESTIVAELNGALGRAYTESRRFDEAADALHRAVALTEKLSGRDSPRMGVYLVQLAYVQNKLGHTDEAIATAQEAVRARRAAFGDNGLVVEAMKYLAVYYGDAKRWREAIALDLEALALAERVHDQYDDVPGILADLGDAYHHVGEPDKERAAYERALVHPQMASLGEQVGGNVRFGLAQLLWATSSQRPRALSLARQAVADYGKAPPDEVRDQRAAAERWLQTHR